MGGQGSKDLPTTGCVGLSLREEHRKIRASYSLRPDGEINFRIEVVDAMLPRKASRH
jgi:hypothetical protein